MKGLHTGLAALTLAAAAFTTPAFATVTATGTVTGLTVTLISLDGGTPSITFDTPGSGINGSVDDATNSLYPAYGYGTTSTASDSATTPLGSATSSITGTGTFALTTTTSFSASISATGGGSAYTSALAEAYSNTDFTLSPDTIALFSSTGSASVNVTQPSDYGYAESEIEVYGATSGAPVIESDQVVYYEGYGQNGIGQSKSGPLGVGIDNLSTQTMSGELYITAYAFGQSISAVPEPATYALMAIGLGLLGVVTARRRSSSSRTIAWA